MTKSSEAWLANIVDIAHDAIIMVGQDQRIAVFNKGAENIFGHVCRDVIGQPLDILIPEAFRAAHGGHLAKFDQSPDVSRLISDRGEFSGLRKDGTIFPAEASISKLQVDGETIFTVMLRDITERKRVEEELNRRTELVQLLNRTATVANESTSFTKALQDTLSDICAYNGWPVAHVYSVCEKDPDLLVPTGIWHLDDPRRFATFHDVTGKTTFERRIGLPGRVFASGESLWIADVNQDPKFLRAKLADGIGVKAGFACPVLAGSEVVAVMEFFAPDAAEPDRTLLDCMVQVGMQLGRVYERERAEIELHKNQELLEARVVDLRDNKQRLEAQTMEVVAIAEELSIAEKQMKFYANHDALTGLPSLRLCKDRIDMAIKGARRDNSLCGLIFIDLDGFKAVNDVHGHDTGDAVLKITAERIQSCIREVDTAARIGGDEFIIVAPGINNPNNAAVLAERLIDNISVDFTFSGATISIGASIGIALFPTDGTTSEELIQRADKAMYKVKQKGKNNFCFALSA